eukprot:1610240-Rhodomonas_salina.3
MSESATMMPSLNVPLPLADLLQGPAQRRPFRGALQRAEVDPSLCNSNPELNVEIKCIKSPCQCWACGVSCVSFERGWYERENFRYSIAAARENIGALCCTHHDLHQIALRAADRASQLTCACCSTIVDARRTRRRRRGC